MFYNIVKAINAEVNLNFCYCSACSNQDVSVSLWYIFYLLVMFLVQLLSTKIVHFYDKSMKLCQITTNPKTNIFGYGAKPNSTLDTSTAQALKWPT